jgi:hypothetical protein
MAKAKPQLTVKAPVTKFYAGQNENLDKSTGVATLGQKYIAVTLAGNFSFFLGEGTGDFDLFVKFGKVGVVLTVEFSELTHSSYQKKSNAALSDSGAAGSYEVHQFDIQDGEIVAIEAGEPSKAIAPEGLTANAEPMTFTKKVKEFAGRQTVQQLASGAPAAGAITGGTEEY